MNVPITLSHLQQSGAGYCLPACVRMVLAYWGQEWPEQTICQWLGAKDYGTPGFAIQRLSAMGLTVNYGEWSLAQLLMALGKGCPVIIFVRTLFLDYWTEDIAHAIVVVGAVENELFWVHDPALAAGPTAVSWNGMLAAWAEFGYRGAALTL